MTSLKAAVNFESAFAGVRKTVNATEQEFASLETGIREMAKTVPATAVEIANVAEAAGQLGIQTPNILDFSRVMIDLGESTNLSATEAATALARLANITQLPQDQFEELGSTIVALGNNFATTEAEIVEMGLRIAGAGNLIGLSEADILGFSAALSSVGIEAEAGGSSISKLMLDMSRAVSEGGKELEIFARVAGVSVEEFQRAFKEDAAGAITTFIEGLGGVTAAGGDVIPILAALGIEEVRLQRAVLGLAGAGDVLARSQETANQAFADGTALATEAAQRYATTASQWQIFKNRVNDAAITLGDALAPALLQILDRVEPLIAIVAAMAEAFANLPAPVQLTILGIVGLAAVIGPLLVGIGLMAQGIVALIALGPAFALMFTVATGPIGILILSLAALGVSLFILSKTWDDAEADITSAADGIGSGVSAAFNAIISFLTSFGGVVSSAQSALGSLVSAFATAMTTILQIVIEIGTLIYEAMQWLNPFAEHSPSLVSQVEDGAVAIMEGFRLMGEAADLLEAARGPVGELGASLQGLRDQIQAAADEQTLAALSQFGGQAAVDAFAGAQVALGDLGAAYEAIGGQIAIAEAAHEALATEIEAMELTVGGLRDQLDEAHDAFRRFADATIAEAAPFDAKAKEIARQEAELRLAINQLKQSGDLTAVEVTRKTDSKGKVTETRRTVDTALGLQVKGLEAQLEQLRLKAEEVDLQKELNIGPLEDQIASLTDTTEALPFADIITGLQDSKGAIDQLTPEWEKQNGELEILKGQYETMGDSLGDLRTEYRAIGDAMGVLEGDIKSLTGTAVQQFEAMQRAAEAAAREAESAAKAAVAEAERLAKEAEAAAADPFNKALAELEGLNQESLLGENPLAEMQASAQEFQTTMADMEAKIDGIGQAFQKWKPLIAIVAGITSALLALKIGMIAVGIVAAANPLVLLVVALVAAGIAVYVFRDEIIGAFRAVWDSIGPIITTIRDSLLGAFDAVMAFLRDNWPEVATLLSAPFFPIVALATDAFGIRSALVGAFQSVWDWLTNNWHNLALIITGPFFGILAIATDAFGIRTALITAFTEVWNFITTWGGNLLTFFSGLPGSFASAFGNGFDFLWQAFRSAINTMIRAWNGLSFKLPSVDTKIPGVGKVGGFSINTPDIPLLARGMWNVPGPFGKDQFPAVLAGGEMVLPAAEAERVRRIAKTAYRDRRDDYGNEAGMRRKGFARDGSLQITMSDNTFHVYDASKDPQQILRDFAFAAANEYRSRGIWVPA